MLFLKGCLEAGSFWFEFCCHRLFLCFWIFFANWSIDKGNPGEWSCMWENDFYQNYFIPKKASKSTTQKCKEPEAERGIPSMIKQMQENWGPEATREVNEHKQTFFKPRDKVVRHSVCYLSEFEQNTYSDHFGNINRSSM